VLLALRVLFTGRVIRLMVVLFGKNLGFNTGLVEDVMQHLADLNSLKPFKGEAVNMKALRLGAVI
jgi:hypothetical protein